MANRASLLLSSSSSTKTINIVAGAVMVGVGILSAVKTFNS
jgi:threonine/homoserine/homoserine lactone efflux protein